jgi:hypothetical protein
LYLATGRGDSVHHILKEAFRSSVWRLIHVGYYNGAFCLPLSEAEHFLSHSQDYPEISKFVSRLQKRADFHHRVRIKDKGWQISLHPEKGAQLQSIMAQLREELGVRSDDSLQMVVSSHSIDLIPSQVSKMLCLRLAEEQISKGLKVIALGDCGAFPGNDFELLRHPFGLSVDTVSSDLETCWNLLPRGLSHTQGTAFYLSRMHVTNGQFTIKG